MAPVVARSIFWIAAATALIAQLLVLRAALAGRTPAAGPTARARALEALWIVLPALALVATLWATHRRVAQANAEPPLSAASRATASTL